MKIVVVYPEKSTEEGKVYQRNHKGNVKVYSARQDVLNAFNCKSELSLEDYCGAIIAELSKQEVKHANREAV